MKRMLSKVLSALLVIAMLLPTVCYADEPAIATTQVDPEFVETTTDDFGFDPDDPAPVDDVPATDAAATVIDDATDDAAAEEVTDTADATEPAADETAADETANDETAADETAADEPAADETAADETAADETAADETKSDETAADETAADETADDETKSDETKSDETVADETKSDETADDETKSDETKSDETVADETKSDESAADESADGDDNGLAEGEIATETVDEVVSEEDSADLLDVSDEFGLESLSLMSVDPDMMLMATVNEGDVEINDTYFPDEAFRNYILQRIDTSGDGILDADELSSTSSIILHEQVYNDQGDWGYWQDVRDEDGSPKGLGVRSLKGIEYFEDLCDLNVSYNPIESLDLSQKTELYHLNASNCGLTSLNLDGCENLQELRISNNKLSSLALGNLPNLYNLEVSRNPLSGLNVSGLTELESLYCYDCGLTSLNVSGLTHLAYLHCSGNNLTTLDLSGLTKLRNLWCYSNFITELDISDCAKLVSIVNDENKFAYSFVEYSGYVGEGEDEEWVLLLHDTITTLKFGDTVIDATAHFAMMIDEEHFPDEAFRQYIKDSWASGRAYLTEEDLNGDRWGMSLTRYDQDLEREVPIGVANLKGIEYFQNVEFLTLDGNPITQIDLSNNPNIKEVRFCNSGLTSLNIVGGDHLSNLLVYGNAIDVLDVSAYPLIANHMEQANPSKNTDGPDSDFAYVTYNWWNGDDDNGRLSVDLTTKVKVGSKLYEYTEVPIDAAHFPDENLRNYLLQFVDYDDDEILGPSELSWEYLTFHEQEYHQEDEDYGWWQEKYDANGTPLGLGIADLTGIEYFTKLKELNISYNPVTKLDLSQNKKLYRLTCYGCELDTLNLSGIPAFEQYFDESQLSEYNFGGTKVRGFTRYEQEGQWPPLASLDYDAFTTLIVGDTVVEGGVKVVPVPIDAEHFPDQNFRNYILEIVDNNRDGILSPNEANRYDLTLQKQEYVSMGDYGYYRTIYDENGRPMGLGVEDLTGIEYFPDIYSLTLSFNPVKKLDLSKNPNLKQLSCVGCGMDTLDLSSWATLVQHFDESEIQEGYGPGGVKQRSFYANLDSVSQGPAYIGLYYDAATTLIVGDITVEGYAEVYIPITEEYFPDPAFRQLVANKYDSNHDGLLGSSESDSAYYMELGYGYYDEDTDEYTYTPAGVKSLEGLQYFTNVEELDCTGNGLTSLDLSLTPKLYWLNCSDNNLTTLDLSQVPELDTLYCSNNNLTALDLSHTPYLTRLECNGNNIAVLDVSPCPNLARNVYDANRTIDEEDGISYAYYFFDVDNDPCNDGIALLCDVNVLVISADSYPVTVVSNENVTLTADKAYATEGATVTVTATPAEYISVSWITVTMDDSGESYDVIEDDDGIYSFVMPASGVTLTAEYMRIPKVTVTAADDLIYNGQDQALIAAAETTGGTLMYKLDPNSDVWAETIPTGKDAGTYTVYYKVQGGGEYLSTEFEEVEVTIAKKVLGLEWSDTEKTYDGTPFKPTVALTGVVEGDECTVEVTGEQTLGGTYDADVTEPSNANYALPEVHTQAFTINKAPHDSANFDIEVPYNGLDATFDLTDALADAESWAVESISGVLITSAAFDGETAILKYTAVAPSTGVTSTDVNVVASGRNYVDYDVTIKFKAVDSFILSFDTVGGDPIASFKRLVGQPYGTLPVATRTGYTPDGWYAEYNSENGEYSTPVSADTLMGGANATIYAKWIPAPYEITLDLNGEGAAIGDYHPEGVTVSDDNVLTYTVETGEFTLPMPTREGFTFAGWKKTEADDAKIILTIDTAAPEEDVTYTAQWSPINLAGTVKVEVPDAATTGLKGLANMDMTPTEASEEGGNMDTATDDSSSLAVALKEIAADVSTQTDDSGETGEPGEEPEPTTVVTDVKVEMNVSVTGIDEANKSSIQNAAADDEPLNDEAEFVEITVSKITTVDTINEETGETESVESDPEPIAETPRVMEIPLQYDLTGRYNVVIYRHHVEEGETEGTTAPLNRLASRPKDYQSKEGSFFISGSGVNAIIYVYTQRFSTYGVSYSTTPIYNVLFENDGEKTSEQAVASESLATKPADPDNYEKDGNAYFFKGWFNGSSETPFDFENTVVTDNLVLTAGWNVKPIVEISFDDNEHTYDGNLHGYTVNVGQAAVEVYFSDTEELTADNYNDGSTAVYAYKDAGTYGVNWYAKSSNDTCVVRPETGTLELIINEAMPAINAAPTANALTYNGTAQALVQAGSATNGTMQYKLDNGTYSEAIPTATNAGSYTVYYRIIGDDNYSDIEDETANKVTVEIAKALPTITVAPTANALTYNGAAQALVQAGAAVNGTMQYKLDNGAYSTAIPTAINPGTYTVYYMVVGNENFTDLVNEAAYKVTVTIAAATSTIADSGTPTDQTAVQTPVAPVVPQTPAAPAAPAVPVAPATVEPTPAPTPAPTPTPTPTIVSKKKNTKATVAVGTVYQIDLLGKTGTKYKSSNKKIVTVSKTGLVTPKKAGKAKITFKVGKKARTITLKIVDPTIPKKVSLNLSGTVAAKVGGTTTLTVTLPEGAVSGIKWTTSNKKIATVKNGVVTFKKAGKVTITATATRGKKKAKVNFKVSK